ncbi:MAG: 4Fe-4S dicluster domain-containing protein [Betaproteobacteria bacterium]
MKYAMVVDLQKCVGCGNCIFACKADNNTPGDINWCDKITRTVGTFPKVRYEYLPKLCNHCTDAPCVKVCPVTPKAMYKADNGLTLHSVDRCIGCQMCVGACPYGVISFNAKAPHQDWQDTRALVPGGTYSPKEMLLAAGGQASPHANPERGNTYPVVRPEAKVEKCTLCDHRLAKGLRPACVEACPPQALTVGDLDDPRSEVSQQLKSHKARTLQPEKGTRPNVYYIRSFNHPRQA